METEEVENLDLERGEEAPELLEADKFSHSFAGSDTETVPQKDTPDSPSWTKRYTYPCVDVFLENACVVVVSRKL
jgi:hypothetical protein